MLIFSLEYNYNIYHGLFGFHLGRGQKQYGENKMRSEYDFSNAKPNPYLKKLRKQISIRIDMDTIQYFKKKASETVISYQNLINLYLSDCAVHKKGINISWK